MGTALKNPEKSQKSWKIQYNQYNPVQSRTMVSPLSFIPWVVLFYIVVQFTKDEIPSLCVVLCYPVQNKQAGNVKPPGEGTQYFFGPP